MNDKLVDQAYSLYERLRGRWLEEAFLDKPDSLRLNVLSNRAYRRYCRRLDKAMTSRA